MTTSLSAMRVFAMNDCDWVAAETLEDAIKTYAQMIGTGFDPEDDLSDPHALTDEQMDKLMFTDEDEKKRTFREQLNRMIEAGEELPGFFATTEF
jgi:hypothetical protein